jgi:alpha 1,2-mannosyltransferase
MNFYRSKSLSALAILTSGLIFLTIFQVLTRDSHEYLRQQEGTKTDGSNEEQSSPQMKHQTVNIDYDIIDYNLELVKFLNQEVFTPIREAKPNIGRINNDNHFKKDNRFRQGSLRVPRFSSNLRENKDTDFVLSKEYLTSFLQVSDNEKSALKESHDKFRSSMLDSFPPEIENRFEGNGIVYVGGGKYNWLVLISLKRLRDTGSITPVEVFIPDSKEYSHMFCELIFPPLGAKCIVMSDYITIPDFHIHRFGLKLLAFSLSSFENILMLDSDNVPIKNPDFLFDSKVYNDTGLVLWPDFWRRSTSPHFYEIAGIEVNEMKQVRYSYGDHRDHPKDLVTLEDYNSKVSYHDLEGTLPEASSETGQILINKKKHTKTLMLSFYYNYYGSDFYYILLGQGQAGEGDKDTFIASAHELGLPYYQVKEYVREFDVNTKKGEKLKAVSSMGQYDPVIDYKQHLHPSKFEFDDSNYDSSKVNYNRHKYSNSSLLFLHCLSPKLTPIAENAGGVVKALEKPMKEKYRIYGDYLFQELGYDFEVEIWKIFAWIVCNLGDMDGRLNTDERFTCAKVREQIRFLQNDIVVVT